MATAAVPSSAVWRLARAQRDLLTHAQLTELGFSRAAIRHRLRRGRLHPVRERVYLVGGRTPTREQELMAAVLACGAGAALSHGSAAEHWRLLPGQAPF